MGTCIKRIFDSINVIVPTTSGKLYDAVAINKYPIIFLHDGPEECWTNEIFINKLHEIIKNEEIWSNSKIYIRRINENEELQEIIINLKEKISYNNNYHE